MGSGGLRRSIPRVAVAVAVGVAFADSSIVVLALPELYATFDTTIEGVAWVITSYNLALALGSLALVPVVRSVRASTLLGAGSILFLVASIACAAADTIGALVAARTAQGLGGALMLVSAPSVLGTLCRSRERGRSIWTAAGTIGAAAGPALGGLLTQAFDWRAIFVAQAPIAGAALLALGARAAPDSAGGRFLPAAIRANAALALVSGGLVGALFLGVLLVVDVFGFSPIAGAAIVSLIPIGAALVRPIAGALPSSIATSGGAVLLSAGLAGLALLPTNDLAYAVAAFALCGCGLGLAVPALTHASLAGDATGRAAAVTVGVRHLGLVLSIAVVAPALTHDLVVAARVAELNGTAVVIDAEIPATTKIPLALDIRDTLDRVPRGEVPDLSAPFEEHGASTEASIRRVRDDLADTIATAITRGFRRSFLACAMLGGLALVPLLLARRRAERPS